ncbi:P-loop containing nucleoside triphosphate hydrolase protein [Pelagophyceae sp. CCMP2097]|nr:P-loop containing nucleoside triphosphate hydrolase protein [Pelagophyceae sp. CCMP2097]
MGLKWTKPTAIQREAIPHGIAGRDVIGLAETGSGKTGAFALPILHKLLLQPSRLFAVALAPTRELAVQIHEVFDALGRGIGLRCCCVVGGIDMVEQAVALAKLPHIVTATPGRLVDHLENTKGFSLRNVKCLVMDEADRMLSMDFEKELDVIVGAMPREGRTSMLFSATMTSKVAKLQRAALHRPVKIEVSEKFATPRQLIQQYLFVPAKYKDCYLAYLLSELSGQTTLIFAATCTGTQRLTLLLRNLGFDATCLHGQMPQPKRLGALRKFKAGDATILVATDVASRGLDIPSVDLVLNYDIPSHGKEYIHRVGRTARAGRAGRAIAFVTQYDVELYQRLEHLIGQKLPAYEADEESALVFLERVGEAQRLATMSLREQGLTGKRGRRDEDDDDDDEEGAIANQKQADVFGGKKQQNKGGGRGKGGKGKGGKGGGKGGGRGGGGKSKKPRT